MSLGGLVDRFPRNLSPRYVCSTLSISSRICPLNCAERFGGTRSQGAASSNSCMTQPKAHASTCTQPAALKVCKESREEALRFYELSFGTTPATINFDFSIDELYFGIGSIAPGQALASQILLKLDRKDLSRIQHLAIDNSVANYQE